MGLIVPISKINFWWRVLRLSELPKCKERPTESMRCQQIDCPIAYITVSIPIKITVQTIEAPVWESTEV